MKKINLKGISEILSEKEMKNVMGGSSTGYCYQCGNGNDNINGVLYGSENNCLDTFADKCPGGGAFWAC